MPETVTLTLLCSAERMERARLVGKPGQMMDATACALSARVPPGYKVPTFAKGGLITCPDCGSALVAQLPGQSIESAIKDNCRPMVGAFRLPEVGR